MLRLVTACTLALTLTALATGCDPSDDSARTENTERYGNGLLAEAAVSFDEMAANLPAMPQIDKAAVDTLLPEPGAGNGCDAAISCFDCADSACMMRCAQELPAADFAASKPMIGCLASACIVDGAVDADCVNRQLQTDCAEHLAFCDMANDEPAVDAPTAPTLDELPEEFMVAPGVTPIDPMADAPSAAFDRENLQDIDPTNVKAFDRSPVAR